MKKMISLRVQRIMLFIPAVNCLILFVWLFNYHNSQKEAGTFVKSLAVIFGTGVPLAVFQLGLSRIFEKDSVALLIINAVFIYLIPFSLGFALIEYQKKIFKT